MNIYKLQRYAGDDDTQSRAPNVTTKSMSYEG